MENKRGLFIVIEGVDGSGKTTQANLRAEYLRRPAPCKMFAHVPPSCIFSSAAFCGDAKVLFRFQPPLRGVLGGDSARERRFKIRSDRGKAVICHDAEIVRAQHIGRALRELF